MTPRHWLWNSHKYELLVEIRISTNVSKMYQLCAAFGFWTNIMQMLLVMNKCVFGKYLQRRGWACELQQGGVAI